MGWNIYEVLNPCNPLSRNSVDPGRAKVSCRIAPDRFEFPSNNPDIAKVAVADRLGDDAREDPSSEIEEWLAELRTRHPEKVNSK